jgi:hypothetical protein
MKPSLANTAKIAFLVFEAGIDTVSLRILLAFLILVSISAIGSVILINSSSFRLGKNDYQLAFLTPGISPL